MKTLVVVAVALLFLATGTSATTMSSRDFDKKIESPAPIGSGEPVWKIVPEDEPFDWCPPRSKKWGWNWRRVFGSCECGELKPTAALQVWKRNKPMPRTDPLELW